VTIAVTGEHEELAASVRGWCDAHLDGELLRDLARAAADRGATRDGASVGAVGGLPSQVWRSLVGQGLVGIHVPEADGGDGYGPVELAVVLEQLGRALLPGPHLPTVLASSLLARAADGAAARTMLERLATGATGAVALRPDTVRLVEEGDEVVLAGNTQVLGGADADVLLLAAAQDGRVVWVMVEGHEVARRALDSLDVTRPVAEVVAADLRLSSGRVLGHLDAVLVHEVAVALATAEAAGVADWCLATATAYAKTREQFGRPIGQFQGTKHRCGDILVDVERTRAVAWDAARALDDDEARPLAASAAAAIGLEAAVRCAEEAIQVLGGIGYTWEHAAHLYLRRAVSLRALVGGDLDAWRRSAARHAFAGRRRELRLELHDDGADDPVRAEVREQLRVAAELDGQARREHLADAGIVAPHWPPPHGRGADAREQLVIDQELAAAGLTRPVLAIGSWAAPTIIAHGTDEQRDRFIRPTLTGEIFWCQLFSEPEAGSDLAALRTRAQKTDGGWILNGRKVWTSLAQISNWGICLARTDPDAPKHRGITYFLVDMASDGIEIRPIRDITGAENFNEVLLTDLFVPDEHVVGMVDDGWSLARTTLANERVGLSDTSTWGSDVGGVLEQVRALKEQAGAGAAGVPSAGDDASAGQTSGATHDLERHLGQLVCEGQTLRLLGFRITLRHLTGTDPGPTANVRKLVSMQHSRDVAEAGLRLLGPAAAVAVDAGARWGREYLAARAYTIGGGTTEVLRNQIAERLLGLPRDP
jgi:3-oxochol-4-en-24-oyl-CoA dehydrogenase